MATVPLGRYLFERIREVGIRSIHGVPGDFNLNLLDHIYETPGLSWVGNANELNASYSADGYARVKSIPGCLVTTHGVGELSAINGIAGAASERVPVIHIAGQTPRPVQEKHLCIHHSIGRVPDHQLYNKISKPLRATAAELWEPANAPAEIDRVIRECFLRREPVYIFVPIDLADEKVPASLLDAPIDISWPSNPDSETELTHIIVSALYKSTNPSLFVDHLVHQYGEREAVALAEKIQIPTYTAQMSQGIIDYDRPYYSGIFNGNITWPGTEKIRESDVVLALGWWDTDLNNAFFSRQIPVEKRIEIGEDHTIVFGKRYDNVYMARVLSSLTNAIETSKLPQVTYPTKGPSPIPSDNGAKHLTQSYLWPRVGRFIRAGDVLLADTGTATSGLPDADIPKIHKHIAQLYWGSIGYATPAALGADLALKELHEETGAPRGRTLLFVGDGSLQVTVQEVGTMVARGCRVIVFILNNNGYTIERAIHGARQKYNDIARYDWSKMLALFGAQQPERQFRRVQTKEEFEKLCEDSDFADSEQVQVCELVLDQLDIPWRLAHALATRPGMKEYLRDEGFTNSPAP